MLVDCVGTVKLHYALVLWTMRTLCVRVHSILYAAVAFRYFVIFLYIMSYYLVDYNIR